MESCERQGQTPRARTVRPREQCTQHTRNRQLLADLAEVRKVCAQVSTLNRVQKETEVSLESGRAVCDQPPLPLLINENRKPLHYARPFGSRLRCFENMIILTSQALSLLLSLPLLLLLAPACASCGGRYRRSRPALDSLHHVSSQLLGR